MIIDSTSGNSVLTKYFLTAIFCCFLVKSTFAEEIDLNEEAKTLATVKTAHFYCDGYSSHKAIDQHIGEFLTEHGWMIGSYIEYRISSEKLFDGFERAETREMCDLIENMFILAVD